MTDDFLSPDDHTPPAGDDTEEHLAEDVGLVPLPHEDDENPHSVGANPGRTFLPRPAARTAPQVATASRTRSGMSKFA